MPKSRVWLDRSALNALLTHRLRQALGCPTAAVTVGQSHDAGPNESNWKEFTYAAKEDVDPRLLRAVAGGVVSEARERYNVLDG